MLLQLPDIGQGGPQRMEISGRQERERGRRRRERRREAVSGRTWCRIWNTISGVHLVTQCYRRLNPLQGNPLIPERHDYRTTQETLNLGDKNLKELNQSESALRTFQMSVEQEGIAHFSNICQLSRFFMPTFINENSALSALSMRPRISIFYS